MLPNRQRRSAPGAVLALCGLVVPAVLSAQNANYPLPLRFETPRFEVVVVDGLATELTIGAESMERLLGMCKNVLPIEPADSIRLVDIARRGSSGRDGTITFFAVQRTAVRAECGDRDNQWRWAPTQGVFFALDSTGIAWARFTGATLGRGAASVRDVAVAVQPAIWLTAEGVVESPAGLLRITAPESALLPRGMEPVEPLWIEFVVDSTSNPIRAEVPVEVVRGLRERRVMAHLARATAGRPDPSMVFVLPAAPRDHALKAAHLAYAAGNHANASVLLVQRLRDGHLERADLRSARVQLGLVALGYGDTASARLVFEDAIAADPCLGLSDAASPGARTFVNAIGEEFAMAHPRERCRQTALAIVALRGTILPGFGRPVGTLRRSAAPATALIIGTVVVQGFLKAEASEREYDRYLAAEQLAGESDAVAQQRIAKIYKNSESFRSNALTWYRVGAVLWVASAVESVFSEYRAHRRAEMLGNYGSPPGSRIATRPAIAPIVGSDRVGLSISFF